MESKITNYLQIAVTGHRFIPKDTSSLSDAIRQVLQDILSQHYETPIMLHSALAEGSDQLVAKISNEFPEISLCVPLPKAEGDYLEDFVSAAGRESFEKLLSKAAKIIYLSTSDEGQSDYENLGNYLVNQSDVLIALWNGVYNQKKGGTGEVVKAALKARKPVYWIYCPNEKASANNQLEGCKQIGDLEIFQ
ncbi:MAG: hypothetical protein K0B06_09470 [Brevefilum sp.]|nr:hypothetical protein [Brevefilum sp.]